MAFRLLLAGLILLPTLLITQGCGQKGALYMPDQAPPAHQADQPCRTPSCAALQASSPDKDNIPDEDTPEKETPE
jgi:predicted small lipoprotein YifL